MDPPEAPTRTWEAPANSGAFPFGENRNSVQGTRASARCPQCQQAPCRQSSFQRCHNFLGRPGVTSWLHGRQNQTFGTPITNPAPAQSRLITGLHPRHPRSADRGRVRQLLPRSDAVPLCVYRFEQVLIENRSSDVRDSTCDSTAGSGCGLWHGVPWLVACRLVAAPIDRGRKG